MNRRNDRFNTAKAALTALGLLGSLALAPAQTISNPSFEANSFTNDPGYIAGNGPITGWTSTDTNRVGLNPSPGNPFADNGKVPQGTNVAFIQSAFNSSLITSLSTVISNLIPGQTYKVNFRVNARASSMSTANLKVDIAGTNIIAAAVTNVDSHFSFNNPYQYFAFDFTAASTNQTMTLRNDATNSDNTVLVDDFSIAVRNSGWSYAAWTNDASSGVNGTKTYTHAYHFGANTVTNINGITFTGIAGANPSANTFSTTGLPNVYNNDTNTLSTNLNSGGSAVLAHDFVWGGAVESLTLNSLVVGKAYVATLYSVGWGLDTNNGSRAATFSVGSDRLTVNQDQFGYRNGIRVSYAYTAYAKSLTISNAALQGGGQTFHNYAFANYEVSNSHALFLIVTNLADNGPGTLRQVIANAEPGDTITFAPSLSGKTTILTNGELFIPYSLSIDASALTNRFKISGNQSSRVFNVAAGTAVTLNSLTIQDGHDASGQGGGGILVVNSANLTLENCTLSGNSANNVGGAIFAGNGANLTITNCTLSGNSSGRFGGGIWVLGFVTINSSTFSGNSAAGEGGGVYGAGSTVMINGSTFSGNSASGVNTSGGGIYADQATTVTINNSTFSGNSADVGGGIYANVITINSSTVSANSASFGGGLVASSVTYLTNCIVAGNSAPTDPNINSFFYGTNNLTSGDPLLAPLGNYGGPTATMRPRPGSPAIDAGLDSVTNFLATDQRGYPRRFGAHVDIGAVEAQVTTVSNLNNSGAGSLRAALVAPTELTGFATNLAGGTLTLTSGQINIASNTTIDATALAPGVTVSGNHASRIFEVASNASVTLAALTLRNGSALHGGAVLVDAGGALTVANSIISSNSASYGGGLVNNGALTLLNSSVAGNVATNSTGGVENDGGALAISASLITGNSASQGGGVGCYNSNAVTVIANSTLTGNTAVTDGGGIFIDNFTTLTINNSTISGNSANSLGGGLYLLGNPYLTNTIVAGNSAPTGANLFGVPIVGANNLTAGNPLLAPLGNYGGPTPTMPPLLGSPAIDAGLDSVTNFLATDQRGYPRLSGAHVDIGAVEAQWASSPPLLRSPARGTNGTITLSFTTVPVADFTVLASTNVALPLGQWSILGEALQNVPGQYLFTDPGATNYPQRFYRVVSP
jgi:hypothetical protein